LERLFVGSVQDGSEEGSHCRSVVSEDLLRESVSVKIGPSMELAMERAK
jgi:hypothetical protein